MLRKLCLSMAALVAMLLSATATPAQPAVAQTTGDCPVTLRCTFVPAAYLNANPADPLAADYGNYDKANRPAGGVVIDGVLIHDAEGTCQAVQELFQRTSPSLAYVSTEYMVCADGSVLQFVRLKDVAWGAGNWYHTQHKVQIEHEGHAALGSTEFTSAMYRSSMLLVRWLAQKFQFPLDRAHVIGHDNVPAPRAARIAGMHIDAGPFWNWQNYMAMLGAPVLPTGLTKAKYAVVAPTWPLSKEVVTGCWPADLPSCVPAQPQPTNFVYLRTSPSLSAPFASDPVLGQGSTALGNNAARAFYGQTFVQAGDPTVTAQGVWYQVWYASAKAWMLSPWQAPSVFGSNAGQSVTPKPGTSIIPVYGQALPDVAEYPADFVPPAGAFPYANQAMIYTIPAGQKYWVADATVPNGFYFRWSFDDRLPYDSTYFVGGKKYLQIWYNGRIGYVYEGDVTVS